MKNNEDKNIQEVKGYKPHDGQIKIHNAINGTKYKTYVIANGRRWGKTLGIINQMYWWSFNDPKCVIYYVSPTLKLARLVFETILDSIGTTGVLRKVNKTNLILEFNTGSKIFFHSAERENAIRGGQCTYLVIDEAAWMDDGVFDRVLKGTTIPHGKKIVLISTPNGKNWFYNMYMRGEQKKAGYKSFTAPSWENPYIDRAELELERKENPQVFAQEYEASFLSDKLTVFPKENVINCTYEHSIYENVYDPKNKYFIGVDLANRTDFTCAIVLDQNKKVVDYYRKTNVEWNIIKQGIANLYDKWNVNMGYVEVNFNSSIFEDLQINYNCSKLRPLTTSRYNKPVIITDLVQAFEQKSISIPNVDFLKNELDTFTYTVNSKTGKIQYSAREGLHDDSVMALSFALAAHKERNPTRQRFSWSRL